MKKIIIVMVILLVTMYAFAQLQGNDGSNELTYTKLSPDDKKLNDNQVAFRLFPTQNMWTFIKLNTRNGQMWQVQYDVKGSDRFESILNSEPQIAKENEINDRFTLHPTQNIYNFLLLDQIDGRVWQVQWSVKAKERFIIPIL